MTSTEAKQRIAKLRKEIDHHRFLYHVLDRQEISDAANDSLKRELAEIERQFPSLVTPDSPTQRVGGRPRAKFHEVIHQVPLLSLEDVFTKEELLAWEERNRKLLPRGTTMRYMCELKIDGLAVALRYRDGVFVKGATRGDGRAGEDVTENLKTIEAIPLRLRSKAPRDLEVRGEVYMTKKAFVALNRTQAKAGEKIYANPRNVTAGSIRQLDPRVTARRALRFFAYDLAVGPQFSTHHEEHDALRTFGFPVHRAVDVVDTLERVDAFHAHWAAARAKLPFEIDGIVVLADDNGYFAQLGVAGKAPRGAVAYKFAARQATTIIEDILVQVGRTGALTPVAVLRPVRVGGTLVSRATLHNAQEVQRKDVRVGDTVIIQRAGDVIPEVVQVLQRLRPKGAFAFRMPKRCPICASPVAREARGVIHRCTNARCAAQQERAIRHFVSRAAVDIEGVGPKLIRKLLDEGLIRDTADLYSLTEADVAGLERYAEKSAGNILTSIAARKRLSLGRFIFALGIRHVGSITAEDLALAFGSLGALQRSSFEQVRGVRGVGEIVAKSVADYFGRPAMQRLLEKFTARGVVVVNPPRSSRGPLTGKRVVVTGVVPGMTREAALAAVRRLGGAVSEGVGRTTSLVVVGEKAGSKRQRAEQRGIPTMDAAEFARLVKKHE